MMHSLNKPARSHQESVDPLLVLDKISAGYGRKTVLENVDLTFGAGTATALLGTNGAGKSTLFKSIVGVIPLLSGEVTFQGTRIHPVPSQNARDGLLLVPEGGKSFHEMTVKENLEMGGFILKNRALLQRRFDSCLQIFPALAKRLHQSAKVLSGGERQMLAISRALMLNPRALLLDEPFLGLAPIMIEEVVMRLNTLVASTGCSIVIAEQNITATLSICSEAYLVIDRKVRPFQIAGDGLDENRIAETMFGRKFVGR